MKKLLQLTSANSTSYIIVNETGIKEGILSSLPNGSLRLFSTMNQEVQKYESWDEFKEVHGKYKIVERPVTVVEERYNDIDGYPIEDADIVSELHTEPDSTGYRPYKKSPNGNKFFYAGYWITYNENKELYEVRLTCSTEMYQEFKDKDQIKGAYKDSISAMIDCNSLNENK